MTTTTSNKHFLFGIHGAGMHGGIWAGLAPHLVGYRLYSPNLPGHSQNGKPADLLPTIEKMADFITVEMDALPVEEIILMGHSMGALAAMAASHHPKVKGLILLGTGVTMPVHPVLIEKAFETPREAQDMILKWGVDPAHPQVKTIQDVIGTFMDDVPFEALGVDLKACDQFNATEVAKRISKPTLIVTGDQDRMCPPSQAIALSNLIKGSIFEYVPNAGHMLTIESPIDTSLKIKAFLENLS